MFPQTIIVCALLLVPGLLSKEPANRELTFSLDKIVSQAIREKNHLSGRGSVLGPWESPAAGLLQEFLIDTSITYVGAVGGRAHLAIATDGSDYFVVWTDNRTGMFDIWGARVDSSGTLLDSSGIRIPSFAALNPSIAFDGTNYLVVWEDYWRGYPGCDIHGMLIDTSGTVVDTSGIAITSGPFDEESPSVSFDGTNYFVVWADYRKGTDWDIYGARVEQSGAVLDPDGIPICTEDADQGPPVVAFDGDRHLVVWLDDRYGTDSDIYGARVDTLGVLLDSAGLAIRVTATSKGNPWLAFGQSDYLVVWEEYIGDTIRSICGTRVDTSGTPLDVPPIRISTDFLAPRVPCVTYDQVNYLVVWQSLRSGSGLEIFGCRVDESGAVLDSTPLELSLSRPGYEQYPAAASHGGRYIIMWEDYTARHDLYGVRVDTTGGILDTAAFCISSAAHPEWRASASYDGSDYLVVWEDGRCGAGTDIYGARVSSMGPVLDPRGFPVCSTGHSQYSPSSAFGLGYFLIVWQDLRGVNLDVYGARVNTGGMVQEPEGILISGHSDDQMVPNVAFGGSAFLVTWTDCRSDWGNVYGARLDTSGTVLDVLGIPICEEIGEQSCSPVAYDGAHFVVAWIDPRDSVHTSVYAARVDTSGVVLDSAGIPVCTSMNANQCPSIACGEGGCLIVWSSCSGDTCRVYGARLDSSGTVLDTSAIPISPPSDTARDVSVAFDGVDYVVSWASPPWSWTWSGIRGARVDTAGLVLDPSGLDFVSEAYGRFDPGLVAGADGQVLLTYHGFIAESYNSNRVFGAFYTGVGIEEEESRPARDHLTLRLHQNTPNPFRGQTTLQYGVQTRNKVSLKVYDSSGRLVKTLVDGDRPAGSYSATWDGKGTSGEQLPSGIYFCRLQAGDATATRKMILLR
jgi:hypothetical protein